MASAQVLPNSAASSRKQEHLEAGKRRLEEFRKKKAAERSKKASSTSQTPASEFNLSEKLPLETENARVRGSDRAGTSNGPGSAVTEPSSVSINNDDSEIDFASKNEQASSNNAHSSFPFVMNDYNSLPLDRMKKHASDQDIKRYSDMGSGGVVNVNQIHGTEGTYNNYDEYSGTLGRHAYGSGTKPEQSTYLRSQESQNFDSSTSQPSFLGMDKSQFKDHQSSFDSTISNDGSFTKISPQNSISTLLQSDIGIVSTVASGTASSSLYEDLNRATTYTRGFADEMGQNLHRSADYSEPVSSKIVEENLNNSASGFSSVHNAAVQTFDTTGFGSHSRSSSNPVSLYSNVTESNSRRSRPSFLDSLIGPRASSATPFKRDESEESLKSNSLKPNSMDIVGSPPFHNPSIDAQSTSPFPNLDSSSVYHAFQTSTNTAVVNGNSMEKKHEFYSTKQNEDFAALEQHIEDLTQEKFSLQRALEAARALSESLAAENSSLTDTYNQQRSVVDQLKSEMEKLQEEIKAQLAELDAFRNEYANAKLECNAADERAKLLASEVIGLEEKALRLRSSELKLERQLGNSQAEISSYKKKLSSIEKDRMDLQSTIAALQEEKKLLQSKLRKASASGKQIDDRKSTTNKKDVSTSTEDLANEDTVPDTSIRDESSLSGNDASSFPMVLRMDIQILKFHLVKFMSVFNLTTGHTVLQLALEKEELIQTLASESTQCSKLKELNNELSRKLEAQTQRLEFLTAKSMAGEIIPARQPDAHDVPEVPDNTPYADEGDEEDHQEEEPASFFEVISQDLSTLPLSLSVVSSSSSSSSSKDDKANSKSVKLRDDWRQRSRPIPPGGTYPAKDHCSRCGLCDTYYIAHVKNACAFLGDGMSRIEDLEPIVHGRGRKKNSLDEMYFGVYDKLLYARKVKPVEGAQWTGIVTTIAIEMLKTGMVEAVICVQSEPDDRFAPRPILARTPEEVLAAKGVKPTLSPNLNTLALVEAAGVKRLLFCGVGCQVQALRSVEHHLNLEKLYVLGTNCVDNGTREGLDKFLKAASSEPDTVLHYEFMQDYKVHLKHLDGHIEEVPYFCLPANELVDVIAPSCYSCFDYTNALADLVVGYMGVPKYSGVSMTQHPQYVTVRNERGREMLSLVENYLEITPTISGGGRQPFVMETVKADDAAKMGKGPSQPAPKFIGNLIAFLLNLIGPKGLEFARYSLDYHTIRNYLHVNRNWGKQRADKHMPSYAKKMVDIYNKNGEIDEMLSSK
ncbi:hypothetical protein FNV43_RR02151 [Rhamnella rubrinervis]|uniref:7-hydroxymethyl chlorophyll a reductase, chloroplastic n=2 Tax=Magnoliopsida TaxID=3398 RepID=A0A8K0MTK6_9ROSA|nr:hypothetical protein FNV43_RR02151 [Rhamnella rubrinervis]